MLPNSVFPAYAGMFQHLEKRDYNDVGFPRIRGDVPWIVISLRPTNLFSPHTRGCSGRFLCRSSTPPVFPAYAGMFLHTAPPTTPLGRFPRIRGDVHQAGSDIHMPIPFSPHTRGCSSSAREKTSPAQVFPAYAGMFPRRGQTVARKTRFPRIRGDVPDCAKLNRKSARFSPHTRGCSLNRKSASSDFSVFPAYAGMFPSRSGH